MPAVRVWIFTVGDVDVEIVWGVKVGNIVDGGRRFNGSAGAGGGGLIPGVRNCS